jgi:hypothetical protein
VQGQPERSHLSWQAGVRAKAEASAESEGQAGAAGSAAPCPSGRATRPGAACFPDARGPSAGAHRTRPGRTSGGGGPTGAARGSCRRPRHRMAGDRKPTGREPTSRPPAVPTPPPRRCQPRRWVGLTRDPRPGSRCKASAGTRKHVLSALECNGSAFTPALSSQSVREPPLTTPVVGGGDNYLYVFKGARSAPGSAGGPLLGKRRARMTLTRTWRSSRRSPGGPCGGNVARLGAACRS